MRLRDKQQQFTQCVPKVPIPHYKQQRTGNRIQNDDSVQNLEGHNCCQCVWRQKKRSNPIGQPGEGRDDRQEYHGGDRGVLTPPPLPTMLAANPLDQPADFSGVLVCHTEDIQVKVAS